MARPHKDGVDYFPLDVDAFCDKKIQLLIAELGMQGYGVLIALWQLIYRENGYYKKWDDDDCLLISQTVAGGCGAKLIAEVVDGCLRRSIFDKRIFETYGVLTSAGMQRRFIRMTRRRDTVTVIKEYWLLNADKENDVPSIMRDKLEFISLSDAQQIVSDGETTVSDGETTVSDGEMPQRKEKEKGKEKVKQRKAKESTGEASVRTRAPVPYDEITALFNSGCVSLPSVRSLSEQRKKTLSARYRDCDNSIDELKRFFERVEASDFLTGRKNSGRDWQASFDWIMKESNFNKIREGNYDNRSPDDRAPDARTPPEDGYDFPGWQDNDWEV